jgi:branched-chain amino acid transport system substrate-binding protein
MKRFLAALFLALFAALPARADITIGLAGPMTGEEAFFGDQMTHGAEQAVIDINAKGGVNGEKLVLQKADDACDPKQAVSVANKLVSQGIKFVVGHACSASTIPASKIYAEEGVFMITAVSSNPVVTESGYRNVFRACGRDDQQGTTIGQYILKHYRGKKVAIADDQSTWGLGLANEVKKNLNAGGVQETMFEAFAPEASDYSAFISRLKQKGIEVAFLGGYHKAVGLIARQMKEQNAPIQIIGGDALFTNDFWKITGSSGEGVLMSYGPDMRKRPEAKSVVEALRKSGYDPEGYTLNTYAAVQTIAEGLKRAADNADPAKVSAAIRQAPIDTVIGKLAFDAKGDLNASNFVIYRWHDGKYAEVGE